MNDSKDNNPIQNGGAPSQPSRQPAPPAPDMSSSSRSINFLLEIPLELTVEVGRRAMAIGDLIDLMPGTIVELDRPAGEQLDILANGKLVARGEAVVVGDRYGVRVLEIVGDNQIQNALSELEGGE